MGEISEVNGRIPLLARVVSPNANLCVWINYTAAELPFRVHVALVCHSIALPVKNLATRLSATGQNNSHSLP